MRRADDLARPLVRYRFGKGTADFLLCSRCGIYAAAIFAAEGRELATINVVGLQVRSLAERSAEAVDYESEAADRRRKRRAAVLMPAIVTEERPVLTLRRGLELG